MVMLSRVLGTGRRDQHDWFRPTDVAVPHLYDALGGTVEATVGTDCQRRTQTY